MMNLNEAFEIFLEKGRQCDLKQREQARRKGTEISPTKEILKCLYCVEKESRKGKEGFKLIQRTAVTYVAAVLCLAKEKPRFRSGSGLREVTRQK
jgi:hypothetical protein